MTPKQFTICVISSISLIAVGNAIPLLLDRAQINCARGSLELKCIIFEATPAAFLMLGILFLGFGVFFPLLITFFGPAMLSRLKKKNNIGESDLTNSYGDALRIRKKESGK
jgi:hypothetical protein